MTSINVDMTTAACAVDQWVFHPPVEFGKEWLSMAETRAGDKIYCRFPLMQCQLPWRVSSETSIPVTFQVARQDLARMKHHLQTMESAAIQSVVEHRQHWFLAETDDEEEVTEAELREKNYFHSNFEITPNMQGFVTMQLSVHPGLAQWNSHDVMAYDYQQRAVDPSLFWSPKQHVFVTVLAQCVGILSDSTSDLDIAFSLLFDIRQLCVMPGPNQVPMLLPIAEVDSDEFESESESEPGSESETSEQPPEEEDPSEDEIRSEESLDDASEDREDEEPELPIADPPLDDPIADPPLDDPIDEIDEIDEDPTPVESETYAVDFDVADEDTDATQPSLLWLDVVEKQRAEILQQYIEQRVALRNPMALQDLQWVDGKCQLSS